MQRVGIIVRDGRYGVEDVADVSLKIEIIVKVMNVTDGAIDMPLYLRELSAKPKDGKREHSSFIVFVQRSPVCEPSRGIVKLHYNRHDLVVIREGDVGVMEKPSRTIANVAGQP